MDAQGDRAVEGQGRTVTKRMSDEEFLKTDRDLMNRWREMDLFRLEARRARESEAALEAQVEAYVVAHAENLELRMRLTEQDNQLARFATLEHRLAAKTASEARLLAALKTAREALVECQSQETCDSHDLCEYLQTEIAAAEGEKSHDLCTWADHSPECEGES